MTDKITALAMAKSLTGFDEIAILKAFGAQWEKLEGMFAGRALMFVQARRAGAKDADAYRQAMEATIGDVEQAFASDAEGNAPGSSPDPTTSETPPTPTS